MNKDQIEKVVNEWNKYHREWKFVYIYNPATHTNRHNVFLYHKVSRAEEENSMAVLKYFDNCDEAYKYTDDVSLLTTDLLNENTLAERLNRIVYTNTRESYMDNTAYSRMKDRIKNDVAFRRNKLEEEEENYIVNDTKATVDYWAWVPRPQIEKVIINNPATIIFWSDHTKTMVKAPSKRKYDVEKGISMCIAKKFLSKKEYHNLCKIEKSLLYVMPKVNELLPGITETTIQEYIVESAILYLKEGKFIEHKK